MRIGASEGKGFADLSLLGSCDGGWQNLRV